MRASLVSCVAIFWQACVSCYCKCILCFYFTIIYNRVKISHWCWRIFALVRFGSKPPTISHQHDGQTFGLPWTFGWGWSTSWCAHRACQKFGFDAFIGLSIGPNLRRGCHLRKSWPFYGGDVITISAHGGIFTTYTMGLWCNN